MVERQKQVAEVFHRFGDSYRQGHMPNMAACQFKAMHAIEQCRTSAMGGHVDACDQCGALRISYNSCRNRHCPTCQALNKHKWLEARRRELLPVKYFHVVFTLPQQLRSVTLGNPKAIYSILFESASATLKQLSADPRHLGADIGAMAMLHTWNQHLGCHPHLHFIVTGGGLANANGTWKHCKKRFFLPVRVMSSLFRGKFLAGFKQAFEAGDIRLEQGLSPEDQNIAFSRLVDALYAQKWVVYCKPPLHGVESVVAYFARYAYRVAISNERIIGINDDAVTFRYRDRRAGDKVRSMSLSPDEFIRRFLMHILPDRFVKIRYYGILSNCNRKSKLAHCRCLLEGVEADVPDPAPEPWQDMLKRLTGIDVRVCSVCGSGKMIFQRQLMPCWNGIPP